MSQEPTPPSDAYLDTNVIISAIIAGSDNARACREFCARLADGRSRVYFSRIVRLEVSQAILKLATKPNRLVATLREQFELDAWDTDIEVRERWMEHGAREFERLRDEFFQVYEFPFQERVWRRSLGLMARYRLQSHDAIHAATALELGVTQFVTSDDHFLRVDELDVHLIRD